MSTANKAVTLVDMLEAGVHFGHKPAKKHPKMDQYLFGTKNGISIIDLERTKQQLDAILPVVEELAAQHKTMLFLGTKKQAQVIVKAAAERIGMPFVTERWFGGLLTNFGQVGLSMKKLTQLKMEKEQGIWNDRYTKKEQLMFEREIIRLQTLVGGVEHMMKLPDALIIIDCKKEKTAVKEANKMGIPIIALVDSNVNPDKIQFPIPANDDGVKSIAYMVNQFAAAIERGTARAVVVAAPVVAPVAPATTSTK